MKSIRRDIIARGTVGLLKYLRSRLDDNTLSELQSEGRGGTSPLPGSATPPLPDKYTMGTSKSMVLAMKELADIPEDSVLEAVEAGVNGINASKNLFTHLPESMKPLIPKLTDMDFSQNKMLELPTWISLAEKILYINLSNNKLTSFPQEIQQCKHLKEIDLSYNGLSEIPPGLFKCSQIETIRVASNRIQTIPVEELKPLSMLAILDVQNNGITQVPPELGNLTQLRSLQLEGNLFRVPRANILTQGTYAILEYLRDRIPK